ncbi:NnrS family protein [Reyranella sp.]|uniref:NnrS family protein n=1 Tax=Reyranella sp. TaxID=1929291 RepID=UPI002731BB50|nr:NnrS family protein [Reyranella sp.]MDP2372136.1 NnrS family protein [Reyranella sp.]
MAAIPRLEPYAGPVVLSYGFRPFFLLGSIWAGIEVLAWLPMFYGELSLATAFSPRDWHVHELLFGYVPAVVAGFLLTAIPNWTGRLPLQGLPLAGLVLVWLAGRYAVTLSANIGWLGAALVDCAFLVLMAAVVAREIVAGKNWRNLKIVALLCLLAAGNLGFHLEAHLEGLALYSTRLGLAAVLFLIMLVGGRIIPSFTRNWLMRRDPGPLPAPFGRFDLVCLVASGASLALWIVAPEGPPTGVALFTAGWLNLVRLGRWAGHRTFSDRLVLVLHAGYAFVPLGFLLAGLSAFGITAPSAGVHAWAAGAIGVMTLAVMSRASLGHAGRALAASPALQAVYAAAVIAALARICAVLHPAWGEALLYVAAFAWAAAFLGFASLYAPMLCGAKLKAEPKARPVSDKTLRSNV